ncbi:MAG TPA: substrate-binding domain-containing protein, partial [Bacteroidales bacterium]|nr:substrate-binding domain-containing protein [Bacteroidales bacterium]
MKHLARTLLVLAPYLLLILLGCQRSSSSSNEDPTRGNISISGAFALYPLCVQWVEEFNKQYPNIQVDISAGGAGKGMADALSGMVDLGMFSREVSQAEVEKGAWFIAVARDAVLPTMNAA